MNWSRIEFRTLEDAEKEWFCPILKKECNPHCMWIIQHTTVDDDGIDKYHQCAIAYFIGVLLELDSSTYEEGE